MKYFKLCVNVDFEVLIKLNRADEMLFTAKKNYQTVKNVVSIVWTNFVTFHSEMNKV